MPNEGGRVAPAFCRPRDLVFFFWPCRSEEVRTELLLLLLLSLLLSCPLPYFPRLLLGAAAAAPPPPPLFMYAINGWVLEGAIEEGLTKRE
jgi:hypothetical protein